MWIVVCIEIENRSSKQDTGHNGISSTGSKLTPKRACFENACLASCSEGRFTIFKIYLICSLVPQKDHSAGILDLKRYFDNIRRVLYTHGWPRALKLPAVTRAFTCRRAWSRCSPTFCKNLLPLRCSTWILLFRCRPATSHHECWMLDEGWKESQTLSSLVLPKSGSNATQYVPHSPLRPSDAKNPKTMFDFLHFLLDERRLKWSRKSVLVSKNPFLLRSRERFKIWKFETEKRMGVQDIEHGS